MSSVASVQGRLRNYAKESGIEHQRLLTLYFQERFLARLAVSDYQKQLILKGGLYLYSIYGDTARPTKDVDFLGQSISNDHLVLESIFKEVIDIDLDDYVRFDVDSLTSEDIKEADEYSGIRLKLKVYLGKSTSNLQFDIGFGDVVTPAPQKLNYPTLLTEEGFSLYAYSTETVIAEKLQAMTSLYIFNSRTKDFYDLYQFTQEATIDQEVLKKAIEETFKHRQTPLDDISKLFEPQFLENKDKIQQWQTYWQKQQKSPAPSFFDAMKEIQEMVQL